MSCAKVKCSSKNVSKTLRSRCCGNKGITPASKKASGPAKVSPCGCSVSQIAAGYKCINGKCDRSLLQTALEDKDSQKSVGSLFKGKQEHEEETSGDKDKEDKGENLSDTDKDCTDFWGDVPIISWIIPESSRESLCVASKSTQKGYNNCAGLGIPCGYLAIGVAAAIILIMILK